MRTSGECQLSGTSEYIALCPFPLYYTFIILQFEVLELTCLCRVNLGCTYFLR
jgi:hypothetical protein